MKPGSSRGMDTKRPRGSEKSKPCHKLQLTRRSPPPYPWPPEQAQSGVSKPYHTTRIVLSGFELGTNVSMVWYPDRYSDKRGVKMWNEVTSLIGQKAKHAHAA